MCRAIPPPPACSTCLVNRAQHVPEMYAPLPWAGPQPSDYLVILGGIDWSVSLNWMSLPSTLPLIVHQQVHCITSFRPGGGGGGCGLPRSLADPPTHDIRKSFLGRKMKFIKGAGNWRPIVGTATFCGLSPPPPPRHALEQKKSKEDPPPPGPNPPPSPSSNAGESLSFRCNLRVKKGPRSGETEADGTNGGRMVTQTTADFQVGRFQSRPANIIGRPVLSRRPMRSWFGCITIQPLLAATEILHRAVVKEEGQPPPPLHRSNASPPPPPIGATPPPGLVSASH